MKKRIGIVTRGMIMLLMVMSVVGTWAIARTPDAFAGDSDKKAASDASKKEKNGRSEDNKSQNGQNDNDQEHDNRGQVLEIHADTNPQEIIILNGDGQVTVKLMKPKLLETSGVGNGDHIRVTGEKVNELLFEATEVYIRTHCCGEPRSDNDQDSDNNDDPLNPDADNENR